MSVSRASRSLHGERGASAIVVAFSMILMLGFAALAVDVGAGFNERRQDQNAADAAALGGAVKSYVDGDPQNTIDEVKDLVDANVGRQVLDGEWVNCSDGEHLAITAADLGLTPATQCISFRANYKEIRVKIPPQNVSTTFGQILGVSNLTTSAAAQASLDAQGESAAPPFVVLDGTGSGEEVCLRTDAGGAPFLPQWVGNLPGNVATQTGPADPCDDSVYDPASEFFGNLLPYVYEDPTDASVACTQSVRGTQYAIAAGIDHILTRFDPPFTNYTDSRTRLEGDGCNSAPQPNPNTMNLDSGLTAPMLTCGMITTRAGACATQTQTPWPASPVDARLQRGPYVQDVFTFSGEDMDNKALWEFFAGFTNAPVSCSDLRTAVNSNNPDWDYYDKKDALLDCLRSWNGSVHDQLFTKDIATTPRFTFLPYLAEDDLSTDPTYCNVSGTGTTNCVHFDAFVPVFMQALYSQFSGGGTPHGDCDPGGPHQRWGIHQAGIDQTCGNPGDEVGRMTGIVFDCAMLPSTLCDPEGGHTFPGGLPVLSVELTR